MSRCSRSVSRGGLNQIGTIKVKREIAARRPPGPGVERATIERQRRPTPPVMLEIGRMRREQPCGNARSELQPR